ncbi:glycogen/starch/alpha-glucan phosphorylase [Bacillus alkalicellulosilyticus]|uniref:glycogen/starch/alpha-glucan phosphorylase n=1 Tax=Alkalihalobacterium alkalicellulosilyticum TaxID=1912214 RepID=UPI000998CDAE|nr:glycogen/starch/alpha-glucan phosphorylase [Bacillus alkalicellulosilyticus]
MFENKRKFKKALVEKVEKSIGRTFENATPIEIYQTLGTMLKEQINQNWVSTNETYEKNNEKQVYYFSMEFLLGRLIETNLLNMDALQIVKESLDELGIDSETVFEQEHDAGLGNGGLGRLAACFMDSLASLQLAGHGCGIRYKYGLFQQKIVDGNQVELPDYWLKEDYVWETRRANKAIEVRFGGNVEIDDSSEQLRFVQKDYETVLAVPYDVPIVGYRNKTVNTLRLWSAESVPNDFQQHMSRNQHDYYNYLEYKRSVEMISEFLYPDDSSYEGKILRVKQQYFLVSAGIQSILSAYKRKYPNLFDIPSKICIQINDTHPSLVVPELMRILMDEEGLGWDDAWKITTETVAYTNHTTLSEALETWPVSMIQSLLPRIYMIIDEINERFCKELWFNHPDKRDEIPQMAIIAYETVRMAHLAIVGSFSVNGVAKIHTEILKKKEMKNFYSVYPEKYNNKTNGITHRRWLLNTNPDLANLITDAIGSKWVSRPKDLIGLLKYANDPSFQEKIAQVKFENKKKLASLINDTCGITVDEQSIFDVQIKRLHGYKRQLLNIFHVIHLYNQLRENPNMDIVPRTFIFGAKAAPSYHFAKKVIKLIVTAAEKINNDPLIQGKLKVVFLQNYSVSLAEKIIPATDVSEQISTASKEASGTGNMKLMMNGALTLGTLDGANIEIKDMVGPDNIFIFGLTADEVLSYYQHGGYHAHDIYHSDERVKTVLDQLHDGYFYNDEMEFKDIYYSILSNNDEYFVLKDFDCYAETHQLVEQTYRDQSSWLKKSITNIAHSGKFSSDRTISEYAASIWRIRPIKVK